MLQGLDLGGEVADDVGSVSAPESRGALLLVHSHGAVHDTLVRVRDLCRSRLNLEQELDAFDRSHCGL
jgi:hypothetical protein